jgi:hypothetical protein
MCTRYCPSLAPFLCEHWTEVSEGRGAQGIDILLEREREREMWVIANLVVLAPREVAQGCARNDR